MREVKKINLEGLDRARNVPIVHLEVACHNKHSGTTVANHRVPGYGQSVVIEVYADRLDRVAKKVPAEEHATLGALQEQLAKVGRESWRRKNAKTLEALPSDEARAQYEAENCLITPESFADQVGNPTGRPPLAYAKVLHPEDGRKSKDLRASLDLPADKQAEFHHTAPLTPENASARANSELVKALKDAFASKSA